MLTFLYYVVEEKAYSSNVVNINDHWEQGNNV